MEPEQTQYLKDREEESAESSYETKASRMVLHLLVGDSMSDFYNYICNVLTEKVQVLKQKQFKVTEKDTEVLSEYHSMASWDRKEISEIHPPDFLPVLQKVK